jgi:hypothetical protein
MALRLLHHLFFIFPISGSIFPLILHNLTLQTKFCESQEKENFHMKNWKKIFAGSMMALMLVSFTACGNDGNAADEAGMEDNASNNTEDELIEENTQTPDGNVGNDVTDENNTMLDETEGVDQNTNNANDTNNGTAGTTNDNATGNDTTTQDNTDDNTANDDQNNNGTVSGALGDGVRAIGDGVGDAVEDVGDAVGNAANGR